MIYFIQAADFMKIGYTAQDVADRMKNLQIGCPHRMIVQLEINGNREFERILQNAFKDDYVHGEW